MRGSRISRWIHPPVTPATPQLIVGAGLLLIALQLVLRGWALFGSWFYLDDYNLLLDATGRRLTWGYLAEPYNSHLMPAGRLLAWLTADSGSVNWPLAAASIVLLQAAAGASALWMLVRLFGARWGVLGPLAIYLFSAMNVPAMMWWTAALNQVALQAAFFLAVGCWVGYLRNRRWIWLLGTCVALLLGLSFYVKALLIVPVLALLALGYFAEGGPLARVRQVLRRYWVAALAGGALTAGYVGVYVAKVDAPFSDATPALAGRLAEKMIGTAFATGALGGPWRWASTAPPNSFADPPATTVHLAWVLLVLVACYGALHRHRTLRAWALLGMYLGGLLYLLVNSRAPVYGEIIGLEYRYLTDATCALALSLGLAFLPLPGAVESSSPRREPLLRWTVPAPVVMGLVLAVSASGVASTVPYVRTWHTQNASDAYLHTLAAQLRTLGAVDLADHEVPDPVIPGIFAPANRISRLIPLLEGEVTFPEHSPDLLVVGEDGTLRRTLIAPGVSSAQGPLEDCGWKIDSEGRTIALEGSAFDWEWWARIGYLASDDSPVTIIAGDSQVESTVSAGLHSLYVRLDGTFDSVRIDGLAPGTTLCVDTIEVGQPIAGGPPS